MNLILLIKPAMYFLRKQFYSPNHNMDNAKDVFFEHNLNLITLILNILSNSPKRKKEYIRKDSFIYLQEL